jgi:ABC-type Fe3+/spermidine/putrescine transport system ATPase subunit
VSRPAVTGAGRRAPAASHLPAPAVECAGLGVSYGAVRALAGVDLAVGSGEAVALLGPSGAGKTTLLHAVAGFVTPAAGTVRLDGEEVAGPRRLVPPERRRVGVVFQHYALWPHRTALETVAYPLHRAGLQGREARRRALDLLERMGVAALAERRPAEMSGGQQQRVGVARALARDARVFLFDEPTAHLDTALRARLQEEMAERRSAAGAAALYSTHDAAEALAVADRVVLLRAGAVVQVGTPQAVYERPVDRWAALLTGPASVLALRAARGAGGRVRLVVGEAVVDVAGGGALEQGPVSALVRPDWAHLRGPLAGAVQHAWYRGPHTDYRLAVPGGTLDVREPGPPSATPGERTGWSLDRVWLLDDAAAGTAEGTMPGGPSGQMTGGSR